MMEDLIAGMPASKLFRMLQNEDSTIDVSELIDMFMRAFPDASPAAAISIRRWANAKDEHDFPDEQIDGLIIHYLRSSGYSK